MIRQDEHLRGLVADLIAIRPALRPDDIHPGSSLTEDLGFGSIELVDLASRIRDKYPGFDMRRWLARAVEPEGDSVLSMATLLAEATTNPEIRMPDSNGRRRTNYSALARELAPAFAERAAGHDAASSFPFENIAELVDSGYTAMTVPKEFGGDGASLAELCAAQQILAAACGSTAFIINMHVHGLAMIAKLGGDSAGWACAAVRDGAVISGGFSEPGVGGNWWHPTTRAAEKDDGYLLNGRKGFFTGYPGATHLFLSAAAFDDRGLPQPMAFLLPKPEQGIRVTSEWDAAGMRATGSHSLAIENLFVDEKWAVGDRGTLPMLFMAGVHWAWCSFASVFVGIARGALEHVVRTQRTRVISVIGKPNAHLPGVQFRVAEMAAKLAAAEAHLDAAIHADHDTADPLAHYIDMSVMKMSVTRLAHEVVTLGMQVQGGSSLVSADPLQRMYRDVVAGLLVPPATDVVLEWAGKQALGVPIFAEPRWAGCESNDAEDDGHADRN